MFEGAQLRRLGPVDSSKFSRPAVSFVAELEEAPRVVLDLGDYASFERLLLWLRGGALDQLRQLVDEFGSQLDAAEL